MSRSAEARARVFAAGEGVLRVEGALDFGTVRGLLSQGESLIPKSGPVEIDLSGVDSANSAGLALLLEWLDIARSRGAELRYVAIPESLARIAELSNLGSLLPTAAESAAHGG